MSQENVEIVLDQWHAWSNGNLDGWAQAWDPEVVVIAPKGWPKGDVERGLEAWRRQAQRLRDAWAEARIEVDEIRDVKDRVLARFRYVTVGEDTGIPFETPMGVVFEDTGIPLRRPWALSSSSASERSGGRISAGQWPRPSKPPGCGSSDEPFRREILRGRCRRNPAPLRPPTLTGSPPT